MDETKGGASAGSTAKMNAGDHNATRLQRNDNNNLSVQP